MFRKSTLLAVAASAALGLAMLAPTSPAHGGGGHGGGQCRRRPWASRRHASSAAAISARSSLRVSPALSYRRAGIVPPELWYAPGLVRASGHLPLQRRPCSRRPLHLPEQGIHPGRRGAVQGSLHQRGGDEPSRRPRRGAPTAASTGVNSSRVAVTHPQPGTVPSAARSGSVLDNELLTELGRQAGCKRAVVSDRGRSEIFTSR